MTKTNQRDIVSEARALCDDIAGPLDCDYGIGRGSIEIVTVLVDELKRLRKGAVRMTEDEIASRAEKLDSANAYTGFQHYWNILCSEGGFSRDVRAMLHQAFLAGVATGEARSAVRNGVPLPSDKPTPERPEALTPEAQERAMREAHPMCEVYRQGLKALLKIQHEALRFPKRRQGASKP